LKSNPKIEVIISITIGILLVLSPLINNVLSFYTGKSDKNTEYWDNINLDNKNLKLSKVPGRIHIDNNWSDAKTTGICTGSGTYSDPYVIVDLEIDGGGTGIGISIKSQNDYFRIENCTIFNCSSGIQLSGTNNGEVINNICSSNRKGIFIMAYSYDNNITGNFLNHHLQGIDLYFNCHDNIIEGNTVNNSYTGIVIQAFSDHNTVSGNTLIVYDECITSYGQGFGLNDIFNNSCLVLDPSQPEPQPELPPFPLEVVIIIIIIIICIFGAIITTVIIVYKKKKTRGIEVKYPKGTTTLYR